ncbi:hypothetical protein CHS0354_037211 [Potamilus streckersoni]|uniref:Nucleotide-diphospho-sugar transferase domain-containing protein n=1 Tax=Potamilus streckersoni TaxID=2493646 RepID=A0AAE0SY54_9BIVA|nr:hypothetical protein CHS0354_037211 [Potamilus streckersoni]
MFRSGRLTNVWLLSFPCIFVYLYLYHEQLNTHATYKFKRGNPTIICNNNLAPMVFSSKENGTSQFHNSNIKTVATNLSLSKIPALVVKKFHNITKPRTKRVKKKFKNGTRPLLTLFTTWRESKDKYTVHNITLLNWISLRPLIVPVVFTNETSTAEQCSQKGWKVLPVRAAAAKGAPVLKYMYLDVMKQFDSKFYAFANSDILFTDKLVETLLAVLKENSTFNGHTLIVGKRTNVNNLTESEGSSWRGLESVSKKRGMLFATYAEDYFITSASYPWKDIPDIVIGRKAYDNWLVLNARRMKYRVLDATETILAVHQTTNAGNFEGQKNPDADYNMKLLVKLYKKVQYAAGYTECVELFTKKDKNKISITRRLKLEKHCNLK